MLKFLKISTIHCFISTYILFSVLKRLILNTVFNRNLSTKSFFRRCKTLSLHAAKPPLSIKHMSAKPIKKSYSYASCQVVHLGIS